MSTDFIAPAPEANTALKPILLNILAIFFLVISCICPVYAGVIFLAPNSAINPLPPRNAGSFGSTPTNTSIYNFPSTWTPTLTMEPTLTRTPRATAASDDLMPTISPIPSDTPEGAVLFPFMQEGVAPQYSASLKGCAKLYIGGYVYDTTRSPINNLYLHLSGSLQGNAIDQEMITGSDPDYKDGGFEFTLDSPPVFSLHSLSLELLDANRKVISDKIIFNTYEGCDKNLVMINFIQRAL
jgi:hypothetical protein